MSCKDCVYWEKKSEHDECIKNNDECYGHDVTHPHDEEFRPIKLDYSLGVCKSPKIVFYETPPTSDSATICDGSHYHAELITAENFGCVHFKAEG